MGSLSVNESDIPEGFRPLTPEEAAKLGQGATSAIGQDPASSLAPAPMDIPEGFRPLKPEEMEKLGIGGGASATPAPVPTAQRPDLGIPKPPSTAPGLLERMGVPPSILSVTPSTPGEVVAPIVEGAKSAFTVGKSLSEIPVLPQTIHDVVGPSTPLQQDIAQQQAGKQELPPGFSPLESETGGILNGVYRSWYRYMRDMQHARLLSGESTPEEAAQNLASYEIEARKYRYPKDVAEALMNYPEDGTMGEVFSWMINHPKATATMALDSTAGTLVGVVPPILAGAAARRAGPQAGTAAFATMAGLTSGVSTAMNAMTEELQDSGIDLANTQQITNAFSNPEFVERAKKRGLLHGAPVAVMDMLTSLMGAKGVGGR